jgi:hypothetical protein
MKNHYFPSGETYSLLSIQDLVIIDVCYLPKGHFKYSLTVFNPANTPATVLFQLKEKDEIKDKQEHLFHESLSDKTFNFIVDDPEGYRDVTIEFVLLAGQPVKIYFPVGAVLAQKKPHIPSHVNDIEDKINFEIENFRQLENKMESFDTKDLHQGNGNVLDDEQIQSLIHSRYFRGLLNIEDAQKQLEFVIYHKLFRSTTSKGFRKWKLSFYRKLIIFLYRIVAKNTNRKKYFAKLYRNYVNTNLIADNLFDH